MTKLSLEERFELSKRAPGECWHWHGAITSAGRGNFRGRSAPRAVFEMLNGEQPTHIGVVLHRCDNPACVNPNHLWKGTQKDNMQDCSSKRRRSNKSAQKPGEQHSLAKLTASDVVEIKRLAAEGMKSAEIAKRFLVQRRQISRIVKGERWRHAA